MKVEQKRGKLRIHPLFFPLFFWMCLQGQAGAAFLTALLLHEWAHLWVARCFGLAVECIHLQPWGCEAEIPGMAHCSSNALLLVAAAGPACNLACAATLLYLQPAAAFWQQCTACHLAMAGVNLLPLLPMDGGRMASAAAAALLGEERANRCMGGCSAAVGIAALGAGLWLLLKGEGNPSLPCVGALWLGEGIKAWRSLGAPAPLRAAWLGKDAPAEVRVIALRQEWPLGAALAQLRGSSYHLICVLDERGRVCGMLDEGQLTRQALAHGAAAPLSCISGVDRAMQNCYNKGKCLQTYSSIFEIHKRWAPGNTPPCAIESGDRF